MKDIRWSPVRRLFGAVQSSFRRNGRAGPRAFLRSWATFPVWYRSNQMVETTPSADLSDLAEQARASAEQLGGVCVSGVARHGWNVRLDEQIYIDLFIRNLGAKRIFEIGTFDGRTTRQMAMAAGPDAVVYTLDLPPESFKGGDGDLAGAPAVGVQYRGTAIERQVVQLLGDSLQFDFTPYARSMDLVFVDAAHDYVHGVSDSRNAMNIVRPGGIVLWHDFTPAFAGLVYAIKEVTEGRGLRRVGNTSLAVLHVSAAD